MRITLRTQSVTSYWEDRWTDIPVDKPMENLEVYPLKYSELIIRANDGPILEAGCGVGRILRYYHERGYDIIGIDYIDVAISKLREADPTLHVRVGDITQLEFDDFTFKYVLAFGLYHNIEEGLEQAIAETSRVLQRGGMLCASFRADNIQTKLTDWLAERKGAARLEENLPSVFHKMNLTRREFHSLVAKSGFIVETIIPVENMPILYKFWIFRAAGHKKFDETKARAEGYRLSWIGQRMQNFLMKIFPNQFCNVYVIIAKKA